MSLLNCYRKFRRTIPCIFGLHIWIPTDLVNWGEGYYKWHCCICGKRTDNVYAELDMKQNDKKGGVMSKVLLEYYVESCCDECLNHWYVFECPYCKEEVDGHSEMSGKNPLRCEVCERMFIVEQRNFEFFARLDDEFTVSVVKGKYVFKDVKVKGGQSGTD